MIDFNLMYKDVYDHWYLNKNDSFSYNDIYDYVLKKGYDINDEGIIGFRFNESLNRIFFELSNQDYFRLFNDAKTFFDILNGSMNEGQKGQMQGLINQLNTKYSLVKIPYWGNPLTGEYKGDEDIYIISLQHFKNNWENGLSLFEYYHYIRNVIGINLNNEILSRIYKELTDTKSLINASSVSKHLATTESIFRLLEYQELQQSLKESKEAKAQAIASTKLANESIELARISMWIAIGGTILASILTVVFGMNQWKSNDTKHIEDKSNIQINSPIIKSSK